MKIYDPPFKPDSRQVNINDVYSRLDLEIFAEDDNNRLIAQGIDKHAAFEMSLVNAMQHAINSFQGWLETHCPFIFVHNTKYLPYTLQTWCEEHTKGMFRYYKGRYYFQYKEDYELFKLTWKNKTKYKPIMTVVTVVGDYDAMYILNWLHENIGDENMTWCCVGYYCRFFEFYTKEDAATFKLMFG